MAVERKPGGPVFGPLPMLTEPAGEALIRVSEPKPHTMLHAVRDLLRCEDDGGLFDLQADIGTTGNWLWRLEQIHALMRLHAALKDNEQAEVLFTPGFRVCRGGGGYAVRGWHHVLLLPDGSESYADAEVSWHHFRWRANRAGNAWLKRARLVSERIARELSSKIEVER